MHLCVFQKVSNAKQNEFLGVMFLGVSGGYGKQVTLETKRGGVHRGMKGSG